MGKAFLGLVLTLALRPFATLGALWPIGTLWPIGPLRTVGAFRTIGGALRALCAPFSGFGPFSLSARTEPVAASTTTAKLAALAAIELLLGLVLREFRVGLLFAFLRYRFGFLTFSFGCAFLFTLILTVAEAVRRGLNWNRGLHRADEPEIVIRVLKVVFAKDPVAGRRRVARQLQIAFKNMSSRPADFHVRPCALHRPIGLVMVVVMSAARLAAAASLTLH